MSDESRVEGWREFEELAARIYAQLVPQGALVQHNDHIPGRLSGTTRQIDVSIRYEVAGHRFLTVVQARDISTPADVNVIGEFVTVIEDVGANKGVLICRSGFTESAMELARSKGVDLCNVHDAASQKWALEIRVPILWIDLMPIVKFVGASQFLAGDSIPASFDQFVISGDGGQTRVRPIQTFERLWNDGKLDRRPGITHRLSDTSRQFRILVRDSNGSSAWRPIEFALEYTVTQRSWIGSFSPSECIGLLHYEDGGFIGRFPVGAIPAQRDEEWIEIDDPVQLVASVPGSMITTEGWQIIEGSGEMHDLVLRHEETGTEIRAEPTLDDESNEEQAN